MANTIRRRDYDTLEAWQRALVPIVLKSLQSIEDRLESVKSNVIILYSYNAGADYTQVTEEPGYMITIKNLKDDYLNFIFGNNPTVLHDGVFPQELALLDPEEAIDLKLTLYSGYSTSKEELMLVIHQIKKQISEFF